MIARLLVTAVAVLLAAAPASASILRLGNDVSPTFQQIELTVDAGSDRYEGKTTIELTVNRPTDAFRLHAEKLDIHSLSLKRDGEELSCRYQSEDSATLKVMPAGRLEPGIVTLEIVFGNDFDRKAQGLFKVEVEGQGYTFTQFEDDDAREAFPCFDEPCFKFPYQWVLTVPESHLAVTNMPIESEQTKGGQRTVRFKKSPPMPSYLLALATGPFEAVEVPGLGVPGRIITTKGQSGLAGLAVELAPQLLHGCEEYFGIPYPFEKLDLIAVPEFWPGAMENPGLITFAEHVLLVEPSQVGVGDRRRLASTMTHELAHMWFGDMVTMMWWNDLWLNESFAEWLGEKVTHKLHPEWGIDIASAQSVGRTMNSDARPSAQPIRQKEVSGSDLTGNLGSIYSKGQAVLDMYEQYLGEDLFRQCIRAYIKDRAWGNATADDLFSTFSRVAGKDVGAALATFIDQPGLPLVTLDVEPTGKIHLKQTRFGNYGAEPQAYTNWHIPLNVRYADGGKVKQQTIMLSESEMTVDLGTDGPPLWIMPHGDARAYCRWMVPYQMLQNLAQQAESTLTPRERVGYLGNLGALLDAGQLSGDQYLNLVSGFRNDAHPQVLSAVAGAVGNVENSFMPDSLKPLFDKYVQYMLRPALARVGYESKDGEDPTITSMRPRLLARLAESDDPEVVAHMQAKFQDYWSGKGNVDPELQDLAVDVACRNGDKALFDSCKARFETAQVPADRDRYLAALGAFRNPDIQKEALEYALSGPLRPQELWDIPTDIGSISEAKSDEIFHWFLDHYDVLMDRMPPMYRAYMPMIAQGCSMERLEKATAFFNEPAHAQPGLETRLARVTDAVHECVGLREREGAKVAAYLASDYSTKSTPTPASGAGAASPGR